MLPGNCRNATTECPWRRNSPTAPNVAVLFENINGSWSGIGSPLEGNPDIAGLGVMLSLFISSGMLAILHLIHHLVCFMKPPSNTHDELLDKFNDQPSMRALHAFILSFNNTQLVTGFAIFGAAWVQKCTLTIYHLELLCWIFVLIFISTTTSIWSVIAWLPLVVTHCGRHRRSKNLSRQLPKPSVRFFTLLRFLALLVMGALSFIFPAILVSTEIPDFPKPAMAVLAYCFFGSNYPEQYSKALYRNGWPFAVVLVSLMFSFGLIFFAQYMHGHIHRQKSKKFDRWLVLRRRAISLDFLGDIIGLGLVALAIWRTQSTWKKAQGYIEGKDSEFSWGFGQIVPMVLLTVPFISFLEVYTGADEYHERNSNTL